VKLIKTVSLEYREGNSDKVYEVDLCEVGTGQFVVNFRYGRRGSTLREGTKTPDSLSRSAAEEIFDNLVLSKTTKGYRDAAALESSSLEDDVVSSNDDDSPLDPRRQSVLNRLSEGHESKSTWRLSRAVWRAGEMRLKPAEPLLLTLISSGDAMLDYCIVWSLGRCGSVQCLPALRQLEADRDRPDSVRRIAAVALFELFDDNDRQRALTDCFASLPSELAELVQNGPAKALSDAIAVVLDGGDSHAFQVLDILYLINNQFTQPALLELIKTAPLKPNYFQPIRHIFKASELRADGEFFGHIAYRFETARSNFRMRSDFDYVYSRQAKPTLGPHATNAFSTQTRNYLRRRIWRTLQRLGELQSADYVVLAVGVLLPISDNDAAGIREESRYDWQSGNYSTIHFDRYASFWAFNQILYGNSPRYEPDPSRRFFQCRTGYEPGGRVPEEREESFPRLWEQNPKVVVTLLERSCCHDVHRFAVKILRDCEEFCQELHLDSLLNFLRSVYDVTTELGFEIARQRYDSDNPDTELVLALANCGFEPARQQARQWITEQKTILFKDSDFVVALIASPQADTREFARETLRTVMLLEPFAQVIIGRLFAMLQSLGDDDGLIARDVAETLLRVFTSQLRKIGVEVIRDLLRHTLPELQRFAGEIVLTHDTLSKRPQDDLLQSLLDAGHPEVRVIGVQIVGQLPDYDLKNNVELLLSLTRHRHADIRDAIRATVSRLAQSDTSFGRRIAEQLIEALLVPGAPEGVPSHTARVLREDLSEYLASVSAATVSKLLRSRSAPAQDIGGLLLPTNVKVEDLGVDEIVKLADHQVLSIREASWKMCNESVERMCADAETFSRMANSKWDDSRRFAFQFIRDHFVEKELLTPRVVIGICDSIQPDVQQFGHELVTRVFQDEHGEEYVLKLSEHPTEPMQLFASNFLEQHVGDSPDRLGQLAPYFVSVLSRVNKGRVSKRRAYRFLEHEALKSENAAEIVTSILARQSATSAIQDKAIAIETMVKIHAKWPSISVPTRVRPVEVRRGV